MNKRDSLLRNNPFIRERVHGMRKPQYVITTITLYLTASLAQLSLLWRSCHQWFIVGTASRGPLLRASVELALSQQITLLVAITVLVVPLASAGFTIWEKAQKRLTYVQVTPMSSMEVLLGLIGKSFIPAVVSYIAIMPLCIVAVSMRAITLGALVFFLLNLLTLGLTFSSLGTALGMFFSKNYVVGLLVTLTVVLALVSTELVSGTAHPVYSRFHAQAALNEQTDRLLQQAQTELPWLNADLLSLRAIPSYGAETTITGADRNETAFLINKLISMERMRLASHPERTKAIQQLVSDLDATALQYGNLFPRFAEEDYRTFMRDKNAFASANPFWLNAVFDEALPTPASTARDLSWDDNFDNEDYYKRHARRDSRYPDTGDFSDLLSRSQTQAILLADRLDKYVGGIRDADLSGSAAQKAPTGGTYAGLGVPALVFDDTALESFGYPAEDTLRVFLNGNIKDAAQLYSFEGTARVDAIVLWELLTAPPDFANPVRGPYTAYTRQRPLIMRPLFGETARELEAKDTRYSVDVCVAMALREIAKLGAGADVDVTEGYQLGQQLRRRMEAAGDTYPEIRWLIFYYTDPTLRERIIAKLLPAFTAQRPPMVDSLRQRYRQTRDAIISRPLQTNMLLPLWRISDHDTFITWRIGPGVNYEALAVGLVWRALLTGACFWQIRRQMFTSSQVYLTWPLFAAALGTFAIQCHLIVVYPNHFPARSALSGRYGDQLFVSLLLCNLVAYLACVHNGPLNGWHWRPTWARVVLLVLLSVLAGTLIYGRRSIVETGKGDGIWLVSLHIAVFVVAAVAARIPLGLLFTKTAAGIVWLVSILLLLSFSLIIGSPGRAILASAALVLFLESAVSIKWLVRRFRGKRLHKEAHAW